MYKKTEVSIIQVFLRSNIIMGLGSDNNIYEWKYEIGSWKVHKK